MQDSLCRVCTSFYAVSQCVKQAYHATYHATMRHTSCLAPHLTMPAKAACTRLAPRGERVHVSSLGTRRDQRMQHSSRDCCSRRTAWCGSTPTCAWPTSRSTPSTTSSSCARLCPRGLRLARHRVPATRSLQALARRGSCCARRWRRRLRVRAQHLKSTPADYFWWRFKSGEDREGLEKVTRKVTAAEAAQKDADIKAVRRTRQALFTRRAGAGSARREAVCSYVQFWQQCLG